LGGEDFLLSPLPFRHYLDDAAQMLAESYREAFEKGGNLIYGDVEPMPGVCSSPLVGQSVSPFFMSIGLPIVCGWAEPDQGSLRIS
jgi:hypothetical protein